MKKISIIAISLFISVIAFGQSVRTYKTYYDYYETKIKSIEHITQDAELHGTQKYFLEDGCLWRVYNYKFGEKDGIQKQYYCNGKINIITNYKNGIKQGEEKIYKYDKAKYYLSEKNIYDNDIAIDVTTYYNNGNKKVHNMTNGLCSEWYENGKKMTEYTNTNNSQNGKMTVWYENGEVGYIGYYKEGLNDGEWKYYDNKGNVILTEYWKYNSNGGTNRIGKWKIYYNNRWEITNILDSAKYYRIIDYDYKVPKDVYKYGSNENIFKATDFYISGVKQWEGYIQDENININVSQFDLKKYTEVGPTTFFDKDGIKKESGFFMHNRNYNQPAPIRIGKWIYFDEKGDIEYAEFWQLEKGYQGNTSKLISKKDKAQLIRDKADFDQYMVQADKLSNERKYEEAISFYNKALKISPENLSVQKKKDEVVIKNNEKKKKFEEALEMFNKNAEKYNKTEEEVVSLYNVKDIIKSEAFGYDVYKVKKKKLYNAYVILRDDLISKVEKSDDAFYKNEILEDLFKLSEKMTKLYSGNTKDIEKQLKSETNPENIKSILGL